MARVILDVPTEKMQSFIQLIMKLGIDKHSIASQQQPDKHSSLRTSSSKPGKRVRLFRDKFLLFDWEFFSNELEFE